MEILVTDKSEKLLHPSASVDSEEILALVVNQLQRLRHDIDYLSSKTGKHDMNINNLRIRLQEVEKE